MKKKFVNLLDWIYKKKCYFCGNSKDCLIMCSKCYEEMEYLPLYPNREVLNKIVYCAGIYEKNIQKLIRGLKYHRQRDLAYFQAKFMYEYWKRIPNKKDFYQVVPVPLFKKREKSRKYNQMVLVAEEFCKLSGDIINLQLITRIKDTKPQYKLSKSQRMENLDGAFNVNTENLKKGGILLMDDICTTGSTFENIILELKKYQIDDIVCFAATTPNTNI